MVILEKIRSLDVKGLTEFCDKYASCSYKQYVDWEKYFAGEDEDFKSAVKFKGTAVCDGQEVKVLDWDSKMFDTPYIVFLKEDIDIIMKAPRAKCTDIKK